MPDPQQTYTERQLQDALRRLTGQYVTLGCKKGELKEVWYHFNVRGSLQTGDFVPSQPGESRTSPFSLPLFHCKAFWCCRGFVTRFFVVVHW